MSNRAITFSFFNNPIPSPSPSPSSSPSPSLLNHYPPLLAFIPELAIASFFCCCLAISIYSRRRMQQAIDKIPRIIYSAGDDEDDGSCVICLDDLVTGEEVRVLPRCQHVFHKSCIDRWLVMPPKVCPMCRGRVFEKALMWPMVL